LGGRFAAIMIDYVDADAGGFISIGYENAQNHCHHDGNCEKANEIAAASKEDAEVIDGDS
jgi:hypothetical protein